VLGVPIADPTGGFKVFRRDALQGLHLDQIQTDGYSFQIETTWRALRNGCRIIEVPITFTDRIAGASKLSRAIVIEAAWTVWRLRLEAFRIARRQAAAGSPPSCIRRKERSKP
jgi:dolichol-phosphate mannosyltransferase